MFLYMSFLNRSHTAFFFCTFSNVQFYQLHFPKVTSLCKSWGYFLSPYLSIDCIEIEFVITQTGFKFSTWSRLTLKFGYFFSISLELELLLHLAQMLPKMEPRASRRLVSNNMQKKKSHSTFIWILLSLKILITSL